MNHTSCVHATKFFIFLEKRPTPPSRYKCSPKNHFFESAGPRMMACTICGEGCRKG